MNKLSYWAHLINWTRIKSLLWHTAALGASFIIADITTAISNHTLIVPAWAAVVGGLLIAQVTKALNNYLSEDTSSTDQTNVPTV